MANERQRRTAEVESLKWSKIDWLSNTTGRAQVQLNEDFCQTFDNAVDQRKSENALVAYRNGKIDDLWEIDETDICMFQGLFGIRWDIFPEAINMGDMVERQEAKEFFYHAVKGDLHSLELIHPNTLSNLLIAMQNYAPLFDDTVRDEIIHWLAFEANQAHKRTNLKPSDLVTLKEKGKSWPKRLEDELKYTVPIRNESLKEDLVSLKNHLELFLEKNKLSDKVLEECKDFTNKVIPLETETLFKKVKKRKKTS